MHSGRRDAMHDKAEEAAGVGALLSASSRWRKWGSEKCRQGQQRWDPAGSEAPVYNNLPVLALSWQHTASQQLQATE